MEALRLPPPLRTPIDVAAIPHFYPLVVDDNPLFSPRANDFCVKNSRLLAELSLAAYETNETRLLADLSHLEILDCRLVENSDTDTQALVARTRQAIIVAFRGTEPSKLKDLLTDVDLEMVPGPLGDVHRGFWESLESVWDPLQRTIASLQDGRRHLWLTGHSLGGALAQLAVARLIELRRPVQGLYTYGGPRCGSVDFASEYDRHARHYSFRIVNEADIIPDVAPKFLGFEHCGRHCQLDDQGRLLIDTPPRQGLLHTIAEAFEFLFDGEDDHSLAKGYLPKLSALAPWHNPAPSASHRAA